MSLSITLVSPKIIYQSADFRLTDLRTGQPWDFISQKSIPVNRWRWNALVSFVGIGHTQQIDVAEWVASRINNIGQDTDFTELPNALIEADEWLRDLPGRHAHTFTLAAFVGAQPRVILISNHQSLHSRPSMTPREHLSVTCRSYHNPTILIAGQLTAVSKSDQSWLHQLLQEHRPPTEIHAALARVNERAARANKTISSACFTSHIDYTGRGEGIPHGIAEGVEYLPGFLNHVALGLKLRPALDDQGRPKAIQMRGVAFSRSETSDEFHRTQLRAYPNDPNTHNNYGAYLADVKNEPNLALKAYERALDIDPTHSLALGNYGALLWRHSGSLDQAEQFLQKAVDADPRQVINFVKYAEFLWEAREQFTKAEQIYNQAFAIDPQNTSLLLSSAYFNIAIKNYEESARHFEAYLSKEGRIAGVLSSFAAVTYLNGGDAETCVALYREALALQPNLPHALANLSQLLFCRANHGDHYDREASRLVTQCLALDAPNEVRVEVWFYNFAHVPRMREESLRELRSLIYANVRSWGRDFSCNLVRVERDNQDAYDLVSALANVIAGHMEHATLSRFPGWATTE